MKWYDRNLGKHPQDPEYDPDYDADADYDEYLWSCGEKEQAKREERNV